MKKICTTIFILYMACTVSYAQTDSPIEVAKKMAATSFSNQSLFDNVVTADRAEIYVSEKNLDSAEYLQWWYQYTTSTFTLVQQDESDAIVYVTITDPSFDKTFQKHQAAFMQTKDVEEAYMKLYKPNEDLDKTTSYTLHFVKEDEKWKLLLNLKTLREEAEFKDEALKNKLLGGLRVVRTDVNRMEELTIIGLSFKNETDIDLKDIGLILRVVYRDLEQEKIRTQIANAIGYFDAAKDEVGDLSVFLNKPPKSWVGNNVAVTINDIALPLDMQNSAFINLFATATKMEGSRF